VKQKKRRSSQRRDKRSEDPEQRKSVPRKAQTHPLNKRGGCDGEKEKKRQQKLYNSITPVGGEAPRTAEVLPGLANQAGVPTFKRQETRTQGESFEKQKKKKKQTIKNERGKIKEGEDLMHGKSRTGSG